MREPCRIDAVRDDGTLELTLLASDEKIHAALEGIRAVQPLPALYREILVERAGAGETPPLVERRGASGDAVVVNLQAFGWRDKSGDVWLDVAAALLGRGLATIAPGDFPERADYERAASDARGVPETP